MEEELNENDLEERLYAMLHHVDETQNNLIDSQQNQFDAIQFEENGARSTLRRYWRTGHDTNPYHKSNITRDPASLAVAKATKDSTPPTVTKNTTRTTLASDESTPKEERSPPKPQSPVDLSIFHSPVPENIKKTIVFLDHENKPVVLESSDEDEVVEVALPPKPTITIESSDEDELQIKENSPTKTNSKSSSGERVHRDVSASPVPSVVSSVSDEFIRGDCIALNISSRHPDKHSFDFSLHGSDLLVQTASSKKRKRKKNKEAVTSTPIDIANKPSHVADACFATPKSKAKNKKQKSKLFAEKSVPNPDVYDSDSNHTVDTNKNRNHYIVTEKSLPSVDVYDSDSNQSEIVKDTNTDQPKTKGVIEAYSSDSSASNDKPEETARVSEKNTTVLTETVDLTGNENYITIDDTGICDDNIVIGNVTGFPESMDYDDEGAPPKGDISKYVSSKVPSILFDNLDFDNLKGKEKICKKRRYSLTTLRAEMDKFYNESWGGEDFNHKEIQKNMSRDKSLWAIDPKDRMQSLAQRKVRCNYCNRVGHRDDMCRQKPPVCHMCGNTGHYEPRCPTKICVNCGEPNFMYSTMCRNCSSWPRMKCAECGQSGHPSSHCPDIWRRYHNTIDEVMSLERCGQHKKPYQMYCSGCARRGHLLHTCCITLPFSGLPVNSPYVQLYRPVYAVSFAPKPARTKTLSEGNAPRPDRNPKRLSKSPTVHETHANKKRNVSVDDSQLRPKSPAPVQKAKEIDTPKNKNKNLNKSVDSVASEKAPDFIPVNSSNHDNKGRIIQDNEVSDTSSVVTSARIYVTSDIINKLKTREGEEWLKEASGKLNVTVGPADVNSFLSIAGKIADQELFQAKLREWVQPDTKNSSTANVENVDESSGYKLLPKNRNNMLRYLKKALDSLNANLGDPGILFKRLAQVKKVHKKLKKQKVISPLALSNNRTEMNKLLKSLNIILVGQAGLAGGKEHLNSLISYQEKLMSSREKSIPTNLRKEIAEHYQFIFSSNARADYSTLLNYYYKSPAKTNNEQLSKKQRIKKLRERVRIEKQAGSNSTVVSKQSIPTEEHGAPPPAPLLSEPELQSIRNTQHLRDLLSFSRKIQSLRNSGTYPDSKNAMLQLLRRIHPCIAILFRNKNINSKMTKKIKKTENDARKFLANM